MANQKVYVVVTTDEPAGEDQYISDVILITTSKPKAEETVKALNERKPIKGINYDNLCPFSGANYFERTLNVHIENEDEPEGTEGQDRQNYTDTQDRENYITE